MQHLRLDIARMYRERETLFAGRWEYSPAEYRRLLTDINVRIRGYELLLCERFPRSLSVIFPQSEAEAR